MKKEVIFVGWVNQGKAPVDGETTKNQYIIAELEKYCKLIVLDFYQKKKRPWIYLTSLWAFIVHPKATIILSTSAKNVYSMLKLFRVFGIKREIIHWVVGGAFGKYVKNGRFQADVFNYVKYNLVQCKGMIKELEEAGVRNAKFVSNFKPINYYPDLEKALITRRESERVRFVFLSRIMPDKGCDYILEAIQKLNENNMNHLYSVDFYGKIDTGYYEQFMKRINQLENAEYLGLLDLRTSQGYDILAKYHAMLFPTFHPTEGFSGIFIDAFIAGVPILASDWAYNTEYIVDRQSGIIYPTHSTEALINAMCIFIREWDSFFNMAYYARDEAKKYEAKNVLTKKFIDEIGLL